MGNAGRCYWLSFPQGKFGVMVAKLENILRHHHPIMAEIYRIARKLRLRQVAGKAAETES